ncbi:MAG: S41 family peptidase [Patescibacteria group bacterium]
MVRRRLFRIVAVLCVASIALFVAEPSGKADGKKSRTLTVYDKFVSQSYPPFEVERCGSIAKAMFEALGRKTHEGVIHAGILLRRLRVSKCVNQHFSVSVVFKEGNPTCITTGANIPVAPVDVHGLRGALALLKVKNFLYWYDRRCDNWDIMIKNMAGEVRKRLDVLKPRGTIVDLRDNLGGFLSPVGHLLGNTYSPERWTTIAVIDYREGGSVRFSTPAVGGYPCPLGMLVNRNTASAAEMMAMAIRAWCPNVLTLGERTYGKGTILNSISGDSFEVTFTSGEFFAETTAGRIKINGVGVPIDVPVSGTTFTERFVGATEEGERSLLDELVNASVATRRLENPVVRGAAMRRMLLKTFSPAH